MVGLAWTEMVVLVGNGLFSLETVGLVRIRGLLRDLAKPTVFPKVHKNGWFSQPIMK